MVLVVVMLVVVTVVVVTVVGNYDPNSFDFPRFTCKYRIHCNYNEQNKDYGVEFTFLSFFWVSIN